MASDLIEHLRTIPDSEVPIATIEASVVAERPDYRAVFEELERIGTPEERRATHEFLMNALRETRRSQGREL